MGLDEGEDEIVAAAWVGGKFKATLLGFERFVVVGESALGEGDGIEDPRVGSDGESFLSEDECFVRVAENPMCRDPGQVIEDGGVGGIEFVGSLKILDGEVIVLEAVVDEGDGIEAFDELFDEKLGIGKFGGEVILDFDGVFDGAQGLFIGTEFAADLSEFREHAAMEEEVVDAIIRVLS